MKIGDTVYLDYQATTPVDERVMECMAPYYRNVFSNPHSSNHILGWRAHDAIESSAAIIGEFIGADGDEIVFTSGATEANNLAILGVARSVAAKKRRRILISSIEHECVAAAARAAASEADLAIEMIPVDGEGMVDIAALEDQLDDDVLLVSVMAVNNEIGTIQRVDAIGELAEQYGALVHCDAAQAPLAVQLDVNSDRIDLLSLSGHKIYGPKGIGCLYIRRDVQEDIAPIIHGGGQQNGIRSGTLPVALCVGLAAAIEPLRTVEYAEEKRKVRAMRDHFIASLAEIGFRTVVNGPSSNWRHPGNANIQFPGFSAQDLLASLQPFVAAATGSACSSGMIEPSRVLSAIGLASAEAQSSVRFSVGRYTTAEHINEVVERIASKLDDLDETHASSARL